MKKTTFIIAFLVFLAVGPAFDSAIEAVTWQLNTDAAAEDTNAGAEDAPPPDSDPCALDPNLPQCGDN